MTEKVCNRCGTCCSYLPLFTQHMHPEHKKYLLNRGLVEDKKQGCILIPHVCQHLQRDQSGIVRHTSGKDAGQIRCLPSVTKYLCDIHDSEDRPHVCKAYHGQKILKGARIYVPPQCVYSRENEP